MLFKKKISQEYELVDQLANRETLEAQLRHADSDLESGPPQYSNNPRDSIESTSSASSDSSLMFEDLDVAATRLGEDYDNFNEDSNFQSVWFNYGRKPSHKWRSPKNMCYLITICSAVIWCLALFIYSRESHQSIIDKFSKPKTSLVSTSLRNVTLNDYSTAYKNLTMESLYRGELIPTSVEVSWLSTKQYPSDSSGGGYYLTNEGGSFKVLKQVGNDKVVLNFKPETKFAYKNDFFEMTDIILNPARQIDQQEGNWHIAKTDESEQWRHLSFALYWLFNPYSSNEYTPIQPPKEKEEDDQTLCKLHFAEFSPNGDHIIFGYNHDLYIQDLSTGSGSVTTITNTGSKHIFNGRSDWIYEEEVLGDSKMFWWSPDLQNLIYVTLNDTQVAEVELDYVVKGTKEIFNTFEEPTTAAQESKIGDVNQYAVKSFIKYPKPGTPNPLPKVYIYNIADKTTKEVYIKDDSGALAEDFLFYSGQWVNNDSFIMKLSDRTSKILSKRLVNREGETTVISDINTKSDYNGWVDKQIPLIVLPDGGYIDLAVTSDRTYLVKFVSPQATQPLIIRESIDIFDEYPITYDPIRNCVYFLSPKRSTMDSHLLSINLNNFKLIEITSTLVDGKYSTEFTDNGQFLNLHYLGPNTPWQKLINMAELHEWLDVNPEARSADEFIRSIKSTNNEKLLDKELRVRNLPTRICRQIELKSSFIKLNVVEILPPNFDPKKFQYPILVNTYSGPASNFAQKSFNIGFEDVISSSLNCIVLIIDPRGTGPYWKSRSFSNGQLGYWESRDIVTVTKEYIEVNQEFVNPKKVAIWGWSFGGYTTLKTMEFDAGKVFKYGMAVAPVTNWLFYDSIYTERYLSLPLDNEEMYTKTSAVNDVVAIGQSVRFLLLQGTSDDNVHIQNLYWLLDKLDTSGIENFDLQVFPDNDHSIRYHMATRTVYNKLFSWLSDAFNDKFL